MKLTLALLLLFNFTTHVFASEYDICAGIVIDDITEKAYGQHGDLYTGEAICYWDQEKTILKYKRAYINGDPVGRHICYETDGIPNFSISYNKSKIKKYSFNYSDEHLKNIISFEKIKCDLDTEGGCWKDRICTPNNLECKFTCN